MGPDTTRRSIENGRALCAFEFVQDVVGDARFDSSARREYKAYVKKMAPYIKSNGFANTIAFYYAKGSKNMSYRTVCSQLEEWFKEQQLIDGDLLKEVIGLDSRAYRYLTCEAMSFLNWWQRFVESKIEDEKNK